jgi:DNA adenine methylase
MKKSNFILTYNDCPEVRELYKGCKFDVIEWAYGMNKSKKSNEIIITNP